MATLAFRSPVTKPLLRAGTAKPLPPDPRAYDTFRVTQRFDSLDGFYKGQMHNATDVGNFRCGDPVVAMAAGVARLVNDNAIALGARTNALGVVLDHGHGISTEYWHLNRQDVSNGQAVAAGRQIGIVGRTGLGDVCHLHVEAKRAGIRFDPEPLMFGGTITVEDDDVLPAAGYFATGRIGPGNRLRVDHATTDGSEVLATELEVQLIGIVVGGTAYTLPDGRSGNRWYIVRRPDTGAVRQVAHQLVTAITPTEYLFSQIPMPVADCSAIERELMGIRTKLARAATSAAGAQQAVTATVEALR